MKKSKPESTRTFPQWLALVDEIVRQRCGLSVHDLDDCCYLDWYDDGITPKQAAVRAIRASLAE